MHQQQQQEGQEQGHGVHQQQHQGPLGPGSPGAPGTSAHGGVPLQQGTVASGQHEQGGQSQAQALAQAAAQLPGQGQGAGQDPEAAVLALLSAAMAAADAGLRAGQEPQVRGPGRGGRVGHGTGGKANRREKRIVPTGTSHTCGMSMYQSPLWPGQAGAVGPAFRSRGGLRQGTRLV